MITKYAAMARMGLYAFILATIAVALLTGAAVAQDAPVTPAQSETPDILGGREAEPGAWPWQVALVNSLQENAFNGQFCGGTLIDDEWVLTAAHCVDGAEASLIDVLVGAHRLSDSGARIASTQIIPHPDYDPTALYNDLALIRLSTPVTYTPISLFEAISGTTELDYMRATVIGWGAKNASDYSLEYPDALREVSLPLVSQERCARNLLWYGTITEKMICAGYETLTMGACYGDSGGPLMVQKADATWAQVGIVSWGPSGCIDAGRYDVFTRVSQYTEWITTCVANPDALHCRGGDGYETDNGPATAQQLVEPINSQMHTFHEMGDQDWIRVDVEVGKEYIFLTGRITNTVPFLKTALWLFAGDGRTPITYTETIVMPEVSTEPDDFQQSARIVWKADRTGPIYLSVELLPDFYGQTYGSTTRYWLTVGEYSQSFLPLLLGPPAPPAPENDDFAQPVAMTPIPFNHIMDTTDATVATDDPVLCIGRTGSATVWYRLVAPSTGNLTIDTFGSAYDTVLAVFSGTRGALTLLACNDDYSSFHSQVTLNVAAGEIYYIEVAEFSFTSAATTAKVFPSTPNETQRGGQLNLSARFVDAQVSASSLASLSTAIAP